MDISEMIECPTCSTMVPSDLLIPAGSSHICANCREEYLQRIKEGVSTDQSSDWVMVREEHIKHEASLRSIGVLYYIIAFFILIAGVIMVVGAVGSIGQGVENAALVTGMAAFYIVFGAIMFWIGRGYRQLRRWVRIPGTIFAVLGLLSIPIGTLINGYILYLIYSQKGRTIFSDEYQEIREATPEVKYKTSMLVWVFLAILILLLIAAVVVPFFGS